MPHRLCSKDRIFMAATAAPRVSEHYMGLLQAGRAIGRWSEGVERAGTVLLLESEPRNVEHWIAALDELQAVVDAYRRPAQPCASA